MKRRLVPAILLALAAVIAGCSEQPSAQLPALDAQRDATSVSGISSGAYMAGQFEMAHAKDVVGAGIIAGGPYGCSESLFADVIPGPGTALLNLTKAINGCMLNALQAFGVPDPAQLAQRAERLAEHDRIDPIADVKSDRIYLFTGTEDHTVVRPIVAAARRFYEDLGVPADQILYVSDIRAGHAFVTEDRGPACDNSGKPYIVDCDYDQAGALLRQIYGPLNAPAAQITGQFQVFDQDAFTEGLSNHGLSDDGLVYVPQACRTNTGCRVHIAFHGCGQNRTVVGDSFARDSGFARWADTNNMIVLFPQTATTPLNPQGCWDWWGYTGSEYLTRDAPQTTAVYRMLERLSAPRTSS
jgi:poly(3-hydroxybutyrate) depolymerase